jgi:hypothetical protein
MLNGQSKQLWKLKSLPLGLLPTENQIFMACLDAHLYAFIWKIKKCQIDKSIK